VHPVQRGRVPGQALLPVGQPTVQRGRVRGGRVLGEVEGGAEVGGPCSRAACSGRRDR
jgi:hypothetical protein